MAEAVQELYPGTQVTIGPVIENGFYYDFAREEPFTPEDLPKIEAKMREIIDRDVPSRARWLIARRRRSVRRQRRDVQARADRRDPGGRRDQDLLARRMARSLPRAAPASTGKVGKAFKLIKIAGAYWRGDANNPSCSASTARLGPPKTS